MLFSELRIAHLALSYAVTHLASLRSEHLVNSPTQCLFIFAQMILVFLRNTSAVHCFQVVILLGGMLVRQSMSISQM